ncbi:MAG: hypothetical protein ABIR19_07805, partial [Ginsengibacter sp.]
AKALIGNQLEGDSVVIDQPQVIVYLLKEVSKKTNVDEESRALSKKILGNLNFIRAGTVLVNNAGLVAYEFNSGEKKFECLDASITLTDVLIDSLHNNDTTRTLFSKQSNVELASFFLYNSNRKELAIKNITFQGGNDFIEADSVKVETFRDSTSKGEIFLSATKLKLEGLDADEFVKNKNIVVKKITAGHIELFEPEKLNLTASGNGTSDAIDTIGFEHVYSIDMRHLYFPSIKYFTKAGSKYSIGNISVEINGVRAAQLIDVRKYPMDFTREVEIRCRSLSASSKDGKYHNSATDITVNTLRKTLNIKSINIKPRLGEIAFAKSEKFQRDRYDLQLKDISLQGIDTRNLFNKKIIADKLVVENAKVSIYRDLQQPLRDENKVGNYPSQLLSKLELPVDIPEAVINNAFIEYKEKEELSDSTGVISFSGSKLILKHITNVTRSIKQDNQLKISYSAMALETIPIQGTFTFTLEDTAGNFRATGGVSSFDAHRLNKVAIPMALMRINTGTIDQINFGFSGDNRGANGKLLMKYHDLKVDVLKLDGKSRAIKKKGIKSLLANILVINENPRNGELRETKPAYKRDVRKSFFNLIWKTMFTGMRKTVGIP